MRLLLNIGGGENPGCERLSKNWTMGFKCWITQSIQQWKVEPDEAGEDYYDRYGISQNSGGTSTDLRGAATTRQSAPAFSGDQAESRWGHGRCRGFDC